MTRKTEISGKVISWTSAILALAAALIFNKFDMPQKWHAAGMWTLVAFVPATAFCRRWWNNWRFWIVWSGYLAIHLFFMVVVFQWLLRRFATIGTLYVVPLAFFECFLLVGLAARQMTRRVVRSKI